MSRTLTGADTTYTFVYEDDGEFNQDPSDVEDIDPKVFGEEEDVSEPTRNNNTEQSTRPGSRGVSQLYETQFDGETGVDFIMTGTEWVDFVTGSDGTTDIPKTGQIIEETVTEADNVVQTVYTGVTATGLSVDVSVEDTVSVSLDFAYADEQVFTDVSANSPFGEVGTQPEAGRIAHFGHSTLEVNVGDSTVRPRVQDASFTLSPNVEMEYELGTRFAVAPGFYELQPDISYSAQLNDGVEADERTSAYGGTSSEPQEDMDSAIVSGALIIDNGETSLEISFAESLTDSYQRNNIGNPEDALEDDVDRVLKDVSMETA